MKNNRVMHFEIQADDLGRAKEFYEKTFGWKVEKWMSKETGAMDYWGLVSGDSKTPGINGGMYKRDDRKQYLFDCTITVENIDEAINDVKANGGKITHEKVDMPGVGLFARGVDTEGNTFGLMQPAKKP